MIEDGWNFDGVTEVNHDTSAYWLECYGDGTALFANNIQLVSGVVEYTFSGAGSYEIIFGNCGSGSSVELEYMSEDGIDVNALGMIS